MFWPKKLKKRYISVTLVAPGDDCAADTGLVQVSIGDYPMKITNIHGNVSVAGTTGAMTVDVNVNGTTIMGTDKLDVASGAVVDDDSAVISAPNIPARGVLTFDIDAVHTTEAKGLTVVLELENV